MPQHNASYSDEMKATVIRMAAAKATGQEIANAIGRSRNSVMGFCFRSKIRLLNRGRFVKKHTEPPKSFKEQIGARWPVIQKPLGERLMQDKDLLGCRWLAGEPRELNWCNGTVHKHSSWCVEHYRRVYR